MNWMTSAKNRIQRSKNKKNDNLRLIASSKLTSQSFCAPNKKSVILHDFVEREKEKENNRGGSHLSMQNGAQSSDVFMLNNLTRARTQPVDINKDNTLTLSVPKPTVDPLCLLEVSPPKVLRLDSNSAVEELEGQSIQYFNNGELCDELGRLLISNTWPQHKVVVMSPVARKGPSQQGTASTSSAFVVPNASAVPNAWLVARSDSVSPSDFQNSGFDDSWWIRVMSMLDDAKADPALLRVVLQELCGPHRTVSVCSTQGGGACASEGYARSTLKDLPVPSPRAVLNGLYSALSKVGQDPRLSLVVFDVIRMLELVDKQAKDQGRPGVRSAAPPNASGTGPGKLCLADFLGDCASADVHQPGTGAAVSGAHVNTSTSVAAGATNNHSTSAQRAMPSSDFWSDFCLEHGPDLPRKLPEPHSAAAPTHGPAPAPAVIRTPQRTAAATPQAGPAGPAGLVGSKRKADVSVASAATAAAPAPRAKGYDCRSGTVQEQGTDDDDDELRLEDFF